VGGTRSSRSTKRNCARPVMVGARLSWLTTDCVNTRSTRLRHAANHPNPPSLVMRCELSRILTRFVYTIANRSRVRSWYVNSLDVTLREASALPNLTRTGSTPGQQTLMKRPESIRTRFRITMRLSELSRDLARSLTSTFNPKVAGSIPARPMADEVLRRIVAVPICTVWRDRHHSSARSSSRSSVLF
jgi:hypothetical protein